MPILIDYNQVFLSNIFAQKNNDIDENLVRHTVLSCTLSYKNKFGNEFGDVIFCADGRGSSWRKSYYPYYKANRKKNRERSSIDWSPIFESLNKIRDEIKDNLPYKLIMVDNAEADDVISVVARNTIEPVLILSGDQDFIQLHVYPHIKQYAPVQKKYIYHDNPSQYLVEKILKGDSSDNIPNVLSDDDSIVNPDKRQKPLREAKFRELLAIDKDKLEGEIQRNFIRNEKLVDLINFIPQELEEKILEQLNNQKPNRKKLMNYFINNDLKILMSHLNNF